MSTYDGHTAKPNNNCRTCTDFKHWSKQQRQLFNRATDDKSLDKSRGDMKSGGDGSNPQRNDCPLDKAQLGNATWGLLHTMAAFYSDNPTDSQKKDAKTFLDVLSRVYPCEFCAADFRKDLETHPPAVNNQTDFSRWMCEFHNRVNTKLGKPLFDCKNVNERWRDGWLDGSCD